MQEFVTPRMVTLDYFHNILPPFRRFRWFNRYFLTFCKHLAASGTKMYLAHANCTPFWKRRT